MSRLADIASVLRTRLAEIGENVRVDDSQESTASGVLVSYGQRRLAEWRRAPEIVIVPVSSTIKPPSNGAPRVVDGVSLEQVADDLFEVELHIRTPRSDDPEADEERRDRLLYNVIVALGRSRLAPSLGTEGAFGAATYPDEGDFSVQALTVVLPFRLSCAVVQRPPSTDLPAASPAESPTAAAMVTIAMVDATTEFE